MAHDCSDLHQADQILAVMMETGSEILVKYYIENTSDSHPTVDGCLKFLNASPKKNVILLRELVFDYCLGYFILKGGIRKCNKDYVFCGKDLIGELVFGSNHPQYRQLYLYLDFDRACMPAEIIQLTDKMVGVKVNGKGAECETEQGICEHFDFCVGK